MILESQGSQLGYREMILESQGSYVGLQGRRWSQENDCRVTGIAAGLQEYDFTVAGIVCWVTGTAVGARKMILESQGSCGGLHHSWG